MNIELTPAEMLLAATTGIHRHVAALRRHLPDRNGHDGQGWNLHVEGACGEMAVAKALGLFWSASVNTFKNGGDVCALQVRTRSRHDYDLIIRDDDSMDAIFVLATGTCPNFTVRGWIKGADARQPGWRKEYGGRDAAWFVPHSRLMPIEELKRREAA